MYQASAINPSLLVHFRQKCLQQFTYTTLFQQVESTGMPFIESIGTSYADYFSLETWNRVGLISESLNTSPIFLISSRPR